MKFGSYVPDVWDLEDVPLRDATWQPSEEGWNKYPEEHPEVFAGSFLTDGWLFIGFTEDASFHLQKMRETDSNPDQLRAFVAPKTLRELETVLDAILLDREDLGREGIHIEGVGVFDQLNRVSVMLRQMHPDWVRMIEERYGSAELCFEEGTGQPD